MISRINTLLAILASTVLLILPASVSAKTVARGALPAFEEYTTDDGQTFSCTGGSGDMPANDSQDEWTFNAQKDQIIMVSAKLFDVKEYIGFDFLLYDPHGLPIKGLSTLPYVMESDGKVIRLGPIRIETPGQYVIRMFGTDPQVTSYAVRVADFTSSIQLVDFNQTMKGSIQLGQRHYYFLNGKRGETFGYKVQTQYAQNLMLSNINYLFNPDGAGGLSSTSTGSFSDSGDGVFRQTNLHFIEVGSAENEHSGSYAITLMKGGGAITDTQVKPITTDFENLDCSVSKAPDISSAQVADTSPYVPSPDAVEVHNDLGTIPELTDHTVGNNEVGLCATVTGNITSDFPKVFEDYSFEGKAGQVVFLTSPRAYSNANFYLEFDRPDGSTVSEGRIYSYIQTNTSDHFGPVQLAEDGTYKIIASGITVPEDGAGQYAFTMSDLTDKVSDPLPLGSQVSGNVAFNIEDYWFFELKEGESARIVVDSEFQPVVYVSPLIYDPNNIASMLAPPHQLDLDYSFVTTPGIYWIGVASLDDLATGPYTLSISDINNPGTKPVDAKPVTVNLGAESCALDTLEQTGNFSPTALATPEAQTQASDAGAVSSLSSASSCTITALKDANKRSGPGTNFATAGKLTGGSTANVTIQKSVGSFIWWQLDDGSWIRSDLVTASDGCQNVAQTES